MYYFISKIVRCSYYLKRSFKSEKVKPIKSSALKSSKRFIPAMDLRKYRMMPEPIIIIIAEIRRLRAELRNNKISDLLNEGFMN